jgi:hypothetical protein
MLRFDQRYLGSLLSSVVVSPDFSRVIGRYTRVITLFRFDNEVQ